MLHVIHFVCGSIFEVWLLHSLKVIILPGFQAMTIKAPKISAILLSLASVFAASSGWCTTNLGGAAELSYIKYDASENGRDLVSGSSLVQKYSLTYQMSNLAHRSQPRYYNLMAGYELVDFSTKVREPDQETEIKQNYGRMKYSGDVAYAAAELPIRFKAFINDNKPLNLKSGLTFTNLVDDGLVYNLEGRGKTVSSGVSMAFEPETSRNASMRALPRLLLEYRDTTNKSSENFYRIDSRQKELAVAGLNKENNWVNYRFLEYENHLDPLDKFTQQQFQIGLVDHRGRRLWSLLTNWITVSADGQLTDVKSPSSSNVREEYDANLMFIATRQKWDARSFMNYNRQMLYDSSTEVAKIPVYVRGIYGAETDWYVRLGAERGRQHLFSAKDTDTSYSNSIAIGGTTFNRQQFTLSPSISLDTDKSFRGYDSSSFNASVETVSTSRYSNKLWLGAKVSLRAIDDGSNSATSKTWSYNLDLTATYRPTSMLSYKVTDKLESGSGYGFLDVNRVHALNGSTNTPRYVRNSTQASVGLTPNARFATSVEGTYDII